MSFWQKGEANANAYKLYILIPYDAGTSVQQTVVTDLYVSGISSVSFTVRDDTNNQTAGKFAYAIALDPQAHSQTFDPKNYCVHVVVTYITSKNGREVITTRNTKVFYDSVDDNQAEAGDKVTDSPYLYLTNPNAVQGVLPNNYDYDPCCIVLLNNLELDSENGNNAVSGEYEQTITLKGNNPPPTEIPAANITANTISYVDNKDQKGHFEVIVNQPHPTNQRPPNKIRKGRLRNASSDTNPNGFADGNPFFPR